MPATKQKTRRRAKAKAPRRLLNSFRKRDPAGIRGIQSRLVREFRNRYAILKRNIATSILTNDCFDLAGMVEAKAPTVHIQAPIPAHAYKFETPQKKIDGFMTWLREQQQSGILDFTERAGTHASVVTGAWSDVYADSYYVRSLRESYGKGIRDSREALAKAGFPVPPAGPTAIQMQQPFHVDRVGLVYSRAYEDLKTVTQFTEAAVRRTITEGLTQGLARGMAEGRNPRDIGRRLVADVNNRVDAIGIHRATLIARTEVARAHHVSAVAEFRQAQVAGVHIMAESVTSGLDNVCPECEDLANEGPYTLDAIEFMLPFHPQCACSIIPLFKEDMVGDKAGKWDEAGAAGVTEAGISDAEAGQAMREVRQTGPGLFDKIIQGVTESRQVGTIAETAGGTDAAAGTRAAIVAEEEAAAAAAEAARNAARLEAEAAARAAAKAEADALAQAEAAARQEAYLAAKAEEAARAAQMARTEELARIAREAEERAAAEEAARRAAAEAAAKDEAERLARLAEEAAAKKAAEETAAREAAARLAEETARKAAVEAEARRQAELEAARRAELERKMDEADAAAKKKAELAEAKRAAKRAERDLAMRNDLRRRLGLPEVAPTGEVAWIDRGALTQAQGRVAASRSARAARAAANADRVVMPIEAETFLKKVGDTAERLGELSTEAELIEKTATAKIMAVRRDIMSITDYDRRNYLAAAFNDSRVPLRPDDSFTARLANMRELNAQSKAAGAAYKAELAKINEEAHRLLLADSPISSAEILAPARAGAELKAAYQAEVLRRALAREQAEKDALVASLVANVRNRFTEAALRDKGIDELTAMVDLAAITVNYAGQGGGPVSSPPSGPPPMPATFKANDFVTRLVDTDAFDGMKIEARLGSPRASCGNLGPGRARISLSNKTTAKTIVHEIGHAVEYSDPKILRAAKDWLKTRQGTEKLAKLRDLVSGANYPASEIGFKDKLIHPYIGKFYANVTEVISMGLQYLYEDPVGFARKDPEMFNLIMRIVKGAL